MSTQTILHINNPHIEAFRNAGASLTQILNEHYVSNWTVEDVRKFSDLDPAIVSVSIDPITPEDPEQSVPPIVFDPAVNVIQEIDHRWFKKFREQHESLFPAPIAEPDPEPRYKEYMTQAEFIRDLITQSEWEAIAPLANANPTIWAWCFTTNAGDVWVKHPDFEAGIQMGIDAGVWNAERADEIRKGLPIV